MPRNCNCGSQCSCIIREGTGIAITGDGRPENPYVVEATGGGGGGEGFETGDIKWTAKTAASAGWLVADGTAVSRITYADLFAEIGTVYGSGNGTSTFNLPDYTGRFVLGADGAHAQGSSGGSEERTLGIAQVPGHAHSINHDHPAATSGAGGSHDHALNRNHADGTASSVVREASASGAVVGSRSMVQADGSHTHAVNVPAFGGSSGSAGGGLPFSIMPPYGTALPLIKT